MVIKEKEMTSEMDNIISNIKNIKQNYNLSFNEFIGLIFSLNTKMEKLIPELRLHEENIFEIFARSIRGYETKKWLNKKIKEEFSRNIKNINTENDYGPNNIFIIYENIYKQEKNIINQKIPKLGAISYIKNMYEKDEKLTEILFTPLNN